jgi:hypothetical protein
LNKLQSNGDDEETKPPEVLAQEALRVAKNADYLSCHLSFTRRLCDIAERLRFLPIEDRPETLQTELAKLNASGTMGGDPLNKVKIDDQDHTRVVRIPITEGHVFRSKERTPVLLLVETLDEGAEEKQSTISENSDEVDKLVISQVSTESEEEDNNADSDKPAENGTVTEEETKEGTDESGDEEDQAESSPDGETNNEKVAEEDLSEQSPTESAAPVTPANNKKVQQLVETIDEESALSDLPITKASDHLHMNSIPSLQSEDVSMAGSQDGIHGEESGTRRK